MAASDIVHTAKKPLAFEGASTDAVRQGGRRCGAASPDRSIAYAAAFSVGERRQSGTKCRFAAVTQPLWRDLN